MEDDSFTPPTQPFGALVPPPKGPSTAVAAATPAPLPNRRPRATRRYSNADAIRALFSKTLDAVDGLADAVAEGLGLRDA